MRKSHWTIRFSLYSVFFLATAWVSLVGFSRFVIYKTEVSDRNWVPEMQIRELMEYHGTQVLKITQDEVYVFRNAKWIPVLKRIHG